MHPAEDKTTPFSQWTGWIYSARNSDCNTRVEWSAGTSVIGVSTRQARAASVHTKRDRFGYRPPTAYWAKKMECRTGEVNSCYGVLNNTLQRVYVTRRVPIAYCVSPATDNAQYLSMASMIASWSGCSPTVLFTVLGLPLVRQRALENVEDRKLNLALSIAERRKTCNMVADKIIDLTKLVVNVRRLWRLYWRTGSFRGVHGINATWELKKLIRKYRDWPRLWLEYRYGWLPLLYDMKGLVDALEKYEDGTFERYRCHSSSRHAEFSDFEVKASFTVLGIGLGSSAWYPTGIRHRREFCSARYDWSLKDVTYLSLVDTGVLDPALLAWELLPYSFCVDWILRIGGFLDAINAKEGLTFLGGSTTLGIGYSQETTYEWYKSNIYRISGEILETPKMLGFGFQRFVEAEPTNHIVINPGGLNMLHFADALALLYSALTGKSKGFRHLFRL